MDIVASSQYGYNSVTLETYGSDVQHDIQK
jgi:hypothetical protein